MRRSIARVVIVHPVRFDDLQVTPEPPAPRSFSESEVTDIVQRRVRKLNDDLADLKAQLEAARSDLEAARASVAKPVAPADGTSKEQAGQIALLEEKYNAKLAALEEQIKQVTTEREAERLKRLEAERDNKLNAALMKSHCRNLEHARRIFLPQIQYDSRDGWYFVLSNDKGIVSIDEGVEAELPDYLREPNIAGSGSGSSLSTPLAKRKSDLDTAKKTLADLQMKASATGRSDDVARYQRQKKIVSDLEAQVKV